MAACAAGPSPAPTPAPGTGSRSPPTLAGQASSTRRWPTSARPMPTRPNATTRHWLTRLPPGASKPRRAPEAPPWPGRAPDGRSEGGGSGRAGGGGLGSRRGRPPPQDRFADLGDHHDRQGHGGAEQPLPDAERDGLQHRVEDAQDRGQNEQDEGPAGRDAERLVGEGAEGERRLPVVFRLDGEEQQE